MVAARVVDVRIAEHGTTHGAQLRRVALVKEHSCKKECARAIS
jgi:hypothetical protein